MRIQLRRTGGFAGVSMECRVATEELTLPERQELEGLLEAAQPDGLRSDVSGSDGCASDRRTGARDLLRYELSIDRDDHPIELSFDDATLPESLLPLIDWLAARLGPTVGK